jgi:hypothetical protein
LVHFEIIHSILILSLFEDQTLRKNLFKIELRLYLWDDDILKNSNRLVNGEECIVVIWNSFLCFTHFALWVINELVCEGSQLFIWVLFEERHLEF